MRHGSNEAITGSRSRCLRVFWRVQGSNFSMLSWSAQRQGNSVVPAQNVQHFEPEQMPKYVLLAGHTQRCMAMLTLGYLQFLPSVPKYEWVILDMHSMDTYQTEIWPRQIFHLKAEPHKVTMPGQLPQRRLASLYGCPVLSLSFCHTMLNSYKWWSRDTKMPARPAAFVPQHTGVRMRRLRAR